MTIYPMDYHSDSDPNFVPEWEGFTREFGIPFDNGCFYNGHDDLLGKIDPENLYEIWLEFAGQNPETFAPIYFAAQTDLSKYLSEINSAAISHRIYDPNWDCRPNCNFIFEYALNSNGLLIPAWADEFEAISSEGYLNIS